MEDAAEIADLLRVPSELDSATNGRERDSASTSSGSSLTEDSIEEELEEQQHASSIDSETLLDLTTKSPSDERNSLASDDQPATPESSQTNSRHTPTKPEENNEPLPATKMTEEDQTFPSGEEQRDSTATDHENECETTKSTTEKSTNNGVLIESKSEQENLAAKANVSINKTILSDKIPTNPHRITSNSTSSNEDFVDDPTMPDIEAFHCPKNIMKDLAEPMFDMWRLDRDSMVDHIEYMYHDLGIVRAWKIPRTTLKMFLLGVRERYQDNPYHNFKHCFCVTQMAYSILCKLRLRGLVSVDHMGALLTAAVCHDVDHPGLNNSYHCHARTPLAILYNYQSILEQHHFAVTCRILSNKERNIFRNVPNRDEVLTNIGELILATDLAQHKKTTENYTNCISTGFDFKNSKHVMALLKIIIKCADVSNEVRPETVAGPWVERLFAEYYEQSAREKREHLPVTPYMDPDIVNVSESQENFIRGIMLPLYNQLGKLLVDAKLYYINPIYETLTRYELQNTRNRQV